MLGIYKAISHISSIYLYQKAKMPEAGGQGGGGGGGWEANWEEDMIQELDIQLYQGLPLFYIKTHLIKVKDSK